MKSPAPLPQPVPRSMKPRALHRRHGQPPKRGPLSMKRRTRRQPRGRLSPHTKSTTKNTTKGTVN